MVGERTAVASRGMLLIFAVLLLGVGASAGVMLAPDSASTTVDPVGVALRAPRADDGFVLVPRLGGLDAEPGPDQVRLIAKDGTVVHEWSLPGPVGGHVELLPDGGLMYLGILGSILAGDDPTPAPGAAGLLQRVDASGSVRWSHEDPFLHHDFDPLPDGTVAVLRWNKMSSQASEAVRGGVPDTEADGAVWDDEIVEVDEDGDERVVWRARDVLDGRKDALPDYIGRAEWTHANSLRYVPSDPITGQEAYLVSFRQISTIMLVARDSSEVIWRYGGEWVLHQQHDPSLLDNGNILVFDNGQYRRDQVSASAILEIDPRTNEVVWEYKGPGIGGWEFYSAVISGAQRLPNGNTLITEGLTGRLIEVTQEGDVVWEFRNPFVRPGRFGGTPNQAVFKARSYPPEFVHPLLSS